MSDSVLLTKFGNRIIWLLYGSYKETSQDKSIIIKLQTQSDDPRFLACTQAWGCTRKIGPYEARKPLNYSVRRQRPHSYTGISRAN